MAKKAESMADMAKEMEKMTKDMGVQMKTLHATKVTIETSEGDKIVIDPTQCTASVMKGMEQFGISFQISGKVTAGNLKF